MINKSVFYGIITGVILMAYFLLLYLGGMEIYSNWWFSLIMYPLMIALMIFYGIRVRKQFPNEKFNFGKAFMVLMIIGVVGMLVLTIWNIILFNVIDKTLGAELSERIIAMTLEMMEKWGAPESEIEKAMDGMVNLEEQFKPAGMMISWLKSFILIGIVSAISALIIKSKNNPEVQI